MPSTNMHSYDDTDDATSDFYREKKSVHCKLSILWQKHYEEMNTPEVENRTILTKCLLKYSHDSLSTSYVVLKE